MSEQNAASLRIIQALGGSERTGMCRCPAHDDRSPSLHVHAGDNGKVLVKCHAGCAQDKIITWMKAHNLWGKTTGERASERQERQVHWERQQEQKEDEERRRLFANRILRTSTDNLTLVKRYLVESRGLPRVPSCVRALSAQQCREL